MILKSIRLKNFKCYSEALYSFDQGITSICGENGSGKSSILEAISWALFNFLPYTSSSKVIKKGSKSAEIDLRIISSIDGDEYSIKRKTSGASQSVYNVSKAFLVTEGVNNVLSWVRHQLHLSPVDNLASICRNGIATPQGNLTLDFTESPENRRKVFDVLLGLDEYKTLQVRLGETNKLLNEELTNLKIDLAQYQSVEDDLKKIEAEIQDKTTEKLKQEQLINNLEENLQNNKNLLELENKKFAKHNELSNNLQKLKEAFTSSEAQLKEAQLAREKSTQISEAAEKYSKQKERRKELFEQKKDLDFKQTKLVQLQEILKAEKANYERASAEKNKLEETKQKLTDCSGILENYQYLQNLEKELSSRVVKIETEIHSKSECEKEITSILIDVERINKSFEDFELKKELASHLTTLETELENKRLEYNLVLGLEKELKKIPETKSCTLEDINTQLHAINTENLHLEQQKNQLFAQLEVNRDLLPKLKAGGFCPILFEECQNLKAGNPEDYSNQAIEEKLQSLKDSLKQTEEKLLQNKTQAIKLLELQENLMKITELEAKIVGRSSDKLLEEGKNLRQKVDSAREAQKFIQEIDKLRDNLNRLQEKKDTLDQKLIHLHTLEKELPKKRKELSILESQLAELKPKVEEILILRSELQKEEILNGVIKQHEAKIYKLESELLEIEESCKNLDNLKEELRLIETSLEENEKTYLEWFQLQTQIQKLPALEEEIQNLNSKLGVCENELKQLTDLKEKNWFDEMESKVQKLQSDFNMEAGLLHSIKFTLSEYEKRLSELKGKETASKEKTRQLLTFQKREQKITKMRLLFKELSIQLAKSYTEKIGKRATNLFREIMQDGSYELTWTEDYQIIMYKSGQELPFEMLSGGQQTAAAISIRLGLLQELSNIRFAFFDEPTAHLDTERRNQLALQIGSIKSFDQLFVITHDESFASQANNIIQISNN